MIIENFKRRLDVLKRNGMHIQYVLDIGAYRGDFTDTLRSVWPSALVWQIEADERQAPYLSNTAIFTLLGNRKQTVDFYTLDGDKITTGSSIFIEQTQHYTVDSTLVVKKEMETLDNLYNIHNFYGQWNKHGLVKIDTQGSELLILDGATEFLEKKQPRFMLLECSIQEYNRGAPKINTVVDYMYKLDYAIKDVFDLSYDGSGQLLQTDILFERLEA